MNPLYASALLVVGLVLSNVVHAHIGAHPGGSFEAGLLHPFSGLDHLLATVAVGIWAVQAGGRNLFAVPAAFSAAMALGACVGIFGGAIPFSEGGIALSVLMLGLLVAFAVRGSWQWAAPSIALFALFHGYAHGTGIPEFSQPPGYLAGILMATLVLNASGAAAAVVLAQRSSVIRAAGAAISLAGAWLLLAP